MQRDADRRRVRHMHCESKKLFYEHRNRLKRALERVDAGPGGSNTVYWTSLREVSMPLFEMRYGTNVTRPGTGGIRRRSSTCSTTSESPP